MVKGLVSICVPVYNDSNYLVSSLNSLVNQTYRAIEIIVVDDGSDNQNHVREVCQDLNDPRIIYSRQSNLGVSSALNYALDIAKGEYFCWLSHDDVYELSKIEKQVNILDKLDSVFIALYTGYKLIDKDSNIIGEVKLKDQLGKAQTKLGPIEFGILHGCSIIMNLEVMRNIGKFDTNLKYVQDYDYWIRCIEGGVEFKYMDEALVLGRIHDKQVGVISDTSEENIKLWVRIVKEWCDEVIKENQGNVDLIKIKILDYLEFFKIHDKTENEIFFSQAKEYLEKELFKFNDGEKEYFKIKFIFKKILKKIKKYIILKKIYER